MSNSSNSAWMQDELLEIREREEAQEEEAKAAAKAATVAELMQEANLEGVDTLWDDMTIGDEDWDKLGQVQLTSSHHVILWPCRWMRVPLCDDSSQLDDFMVKLWHKWAECGEW